MVVRAGFVLGNENFRRQVEALSGTPQTFLKRNSALDLRSCKFYSDRICALSLESSINYNALC